MSNFMTAVQNTLNNEKSITENGAVGYRTTGRALLDLNFAVASMRSMSEDQIARKFVDAFFEDRVLAMKWLFYARDVRGGLGERRLFRVVIKEMMTVAPDYVRPLISLIPEYGRWDDLWPLLDTPARDRVLAFVRGQFNADWKNVRAGKPCSLLAKWMPSANASSAETRRYARLICDAFGLTERNYRKQLSAMRKALRVVEQQMSAKQWNEINYEIVPSRANLLYNNAFLRNDESRRRAYLAALEKGETKINAGTLYPHDIVHKYTLTDGWRFRAKDYDTALEQLWKALPDTVKGCGNTICVADGSGSMEVRVGNTNVAALSVANALAIYFAERSSGEFRDKYITFSSRPQLVDLSGGENLREKIMIALQHSEVANTNIEAVFDLILRTAVENEMQQEDLPQNVLILSDMEFDRCACTNTGYCRNHNSTLFDAIAQKYAAHGYKLPRLVFWNLNSRTGTIPVKENDLGVALVSGFSVNIVNMVMSGKLDPFECLLDVLNAERYAPIDAALAEVSA